MTTITDKVVEKLGPQSTGRSQSRLEMFTLTAQTAKAALEKQHNHRRWVIKVIDGYILASKNEKADIISRVLAIKNAIRCTSTEIFRCIQEDPEETLPIESVSACLVELLQIKTKVSAEPEKIKGD